MTRYPTPITWALLVALLVAQALLVSMFFPAEPVHRTGSHSVEADIHIESSVFYPKQVTLRMGDHVTVRLRNKDAYAHGFAIAEYEVSEYVQAGEEKVFTFTATKQGMFNIFCNVWCSSEHPRMSASLIVE